ncbi:MAG: hypothetical protein N4A72_02605 [Bacteroidales bacterium]|nr:hypothetical protein [Bacteroidales bacterium]
MKTSSRRKAQEWIFPRHKEFESELREASTDWFAKKGYKVHSKRPYCLDDLSNWQNNIILTEVADYIYNFKEQSNKEKKPFPLHKYAHHGLSSQAMVFNLIGPLITRDDLKPLTELLNSKGVPGDFKRAEFEYEDRDVFNEDTGQPTSIDLVLFDSDNNPAVFIESKFAESEFGGCSVYKKGDCSGKNPINSLDDCYLHFIGREYWKLIKEYDFTYTLKNERICTFVNYYQFFREVLFSIKKGGYFVLLYDNRSPVFNFKTDKGVKGLIPLLIEFVPEKYRHRVVLITIQEVVEQISASGKHNDWITKFEDKYGLKK